MRHGRWLPLLMLACCMSAATVSPAADVGNFKLHLRSRVETAPGSGRYHVQIKPTNWDAKRTAVVVCDMWDKHWCPGATGRVGEMAPRMNQLLVAARKQGSLILHCPSDTMDFYKDTPQRKLAQAAPIVETKVPLQRWCKLDPKEGKLPIDDSDGGCAEGVKSFKAWSRQHPALEIAAEDAVTDSAEAFYLMRQRGIENVVVLGVHTNMCVLGRPFSIRQMVQQGMNVVLVRDLTDTMYNPAKAPFVAHCTGTDLVVEHIERHWCPSVTSADFLGGKEFRFKEDTRPHLVIVAAEDEYKTEESLPAFALAQLGKQFRTTMVYADAKDRTRLPGIEVLDEADAVLLSVRRRPLNEATLGRIRRFLAAGKPLIAIRTSSHAFAVRAGEKVPEGGTQWPEFDAEILGGNYQGHYPEAVKTTVQVAPEAAKHPIVEGVRTDAFPVATSLYKTSPLAAGATVLVRGTVEGKPSEPVAWVRELPGKGKVFYTALGGVDDFKDPAVTRMLANGVRWATGVR